jgi:photosystem II stability/assembly factor-like uncharacterized protein
MRRFGYGGVSVMNRLGTVAALLLATGVAQGGVGVWTTNGPTEGYANGVAIDLRTPSVIYTADAGTGIFRSTDNGSSWVPTGLNYGGYEVWGVDADSTVYATGPYVLGDFPVVAVLSSHDYGEHWSLLEHEQSLTGVALTVDAHAMGILYLATSYLRGPIVYWGLSRSTDGGNTWGGIGTSLDSVTQMAVAGSAPNTLYASTAPLGQPGRNRLYESTDSGGTWILLSESLGIIYSLAVDPGSSAVLYVGTASGLLKSVDGGKSFLPPSRGLASDPVTSLAIDPVRRERVYVAAGSGVFASDDGAASFRAMNAGLPALNAGQLAIDTTGTHLHLASSRGVFDYQIDSGALTLNAVHPFTVTLDATDQRTGRTGAGVATQVNDLWGYFSIPAITNNPNNPEVFVKMLDGTAINGRYWFFYGGLTDLDYTLTVTDATTGAEKMYTKPAGSECGGSDTAAFTP